jgi:S1-C subfamily serine protease
MQMFKNIRRLAAQGDRSVVRIQVARQRPSWTVPWQMRSVESSSGSGAVIKSPSTDRGKVRILTAAHVVSDSTYVTVQRNTDWFDSEKIPAKVVAEFHDTDLALLEIDDREGIFETIEPMDIAQPTILPALRAKVNVIGYPVGGDRVSVTEGVVSRVDMARYSHSGRVACSFTVDAAINAGNSGGPIIDPSSGNILGVAFQKLVGSGVESQGYGVPPYLIWRFLKSSSGNPELTSLGIVIQPLDSAALREFLGASNGVLVNWSRNPALQRDDVIMSVNGHTVDNQGLTNFLGRRIHFAALIHDHQVGDSIQLEILRNRNRMQIEAELAATSSLDLVPSLQYSKRPEYLVIGGLVFQPLSLDYLQGWNERDRPTHLQEILLHGKLEDDRTQAIILTNVLASRCNAGYGSGWIGGPVIKSLNGVKIRDMKHFAELIDSVMANEEHEFLKFNLTGFAGDQLIVLKKEDVVKDSDLIKSIYDIPRFRSLS